MSTSREHWALRFARISALVAATALALTSPAHAQSAEVSPLPSLPSPSALSSNAADASDLERVHADSLRMRRLLADSVLVAGLASLAGGAALMVPSADDQAWRFAGVNTALFGAVNTVVGLLALRGIANEERTWENEEARAARRTPEGLTQARLHAAVDERRESVGHAINLGLDAAYLGVGGTAVLASQLGADHPKRWLASGAAIGFQALFLVGVDFIGLTRSKGYHRAFVERLSPTFAVMGAAGGAETRIGFGGTF